MSKKKILSILGGIVLVLILFLVGYFILTEKQDYGAGVKKFDQTAMGDMGNPATMANRMYMVDRIITNVASDNGRRYLKLDLTLLLDNEDDKELLDKRKPVVKDMILKYLSTMPTEQLLTNEGKDKLTENILFNINRLSKNKLINQVYFTTFVIQ